MKKFTKLTGVLLVVLSLLLLTGCFDDSGLQITCNHDYKEVSSTATCKSEGETTYRCDKCGREFVVKESGKNHDLEVIEFVDSTCSEEGHKQSKCKLCDEIINEVIEKKEHTFGEWVVTKTFVDSTHNEEERECSVCHTKETRLVSTIPEMDLSAIEYDITQTTHTAKSLEEAAVIFNSAILNMKEELTIVLDFEVSDYDKFFEDLSALRTVPFDYSVSSSYSKATKKMDLDFVYYNIPSKQTLKTVSYTQAPSINDTTANFTATRASDFDDFKINSATVSFNVSSTDQLVYALEHRVKPIVEKDSAAEDIYNKIKTVLRTIISDDMTDIEKINQIHDWLVMNVTYDQELVEMMNQDDIKSYNGFYLEGVFNDHYAVCEGISKALCVMANIEGIPCVRVSGVQTSNPNGVGHAWNKVYVDGAWYVIDATSDGTIINSSTEILSYQYYLISDESMANKYTGNEYTDYSCTADYDYFDNYTITYSPLGLGLLATEVKFAVDSQSELNELISYFVSKSEANGTIQFRIDFDYGDKYDDEIATAYSKAHGTKSYSFVKYGDVVTIILGE